mmetsp:Transcript_24504/g.79192  ORF Transcript_24504/g.79192 Transcript_24504/m.79192 type:complete len:314 (-) Transcript_24504:160-1101(-)
MSSTPSILEPRAHSRCPRGRTPRRRSSRRRTRLTPRGTALTRRLRRLPRRPRSRRRPPPSPSADGYVRRAPDIDTSSPDLSDSRGSSAAYSAAAGASSSAVPPPAPSADGDVWLAPDIGSSPPDVPDPDGGSSVNSSAAANSSSPPVAMLASRQCRLRHQSRPLPSAPHDGRPDARPGDVPRRGLPKPLRRGRHPTTARPDFDWFLDASFSSDRRRRPRPRGHDCRPSNSEACCTLLVIAPLSLLWVLLVLFSLTLLLEHHLPFPGRGCNFLSMKRSASFTLLFIHDLPVRSGSCLSQISPSLVFLFRLPPSF